MKIKTLFFDTLGFQVGMSFVEAPSVESEEYQFHVNEEMKRLNADTFAPSYF